MGAGHRTGGPGAGGRLKETFAMSGSAKAMTTCTVAALVVVTAHSVSLGGSAWAWLAWVVLCLVTIGMTTTARN